MKRHQILLLNCLLLAGLVRAADAVPPLLNYQGRLTDEAGQPLASGGYRLAFRLWAEATSTASGNLVWGREFEVTVVGGAFNVILSDTGQPAEAGLNAELPGAFAAPSRFLGLTILRTPAGIVPAAQRKEIMPRQQLLSAPFAFVSARAATAEAISTNATVQTVNLAAGAVTPDKLLPRLANSSAPVGGLAICPAVSWSRGSGPGPTPVPGLEVVLVSSGRPVLIMCLGGEGSDADSYVELATEPDIGSAGAKFEIFRNDQRIGTQRALLYDGLNAPKRLQLPPSSLQFVDLPEVGSTNRYSIRVVTGDQNRIDIVSVRLAAFEL